MDLTGTLLYVGCASARGQIAADLEAHRLDLSLRKEILWESETATDAEVRAVEGGRCWRASDLDHGDGVDRGVQLAVSVAGERVPRGIGACDLDRRGAGVVRVRGGRGEPARRAAAAQQTGSEDRSDMSISRNTVPCSSSSAVIFAALAASCSSKRRTSAMSSFANSTRIRSGPVRGRNPRSALVALTAVSEIGAPPAINSRSNACNWLRARVLLCDRFLATLSMGDMSGELHGAAWASPKRSRRLRRHFLGVGHPIGDTQVQRAQHRVRRAQGEPG